MRMNRVCGWRCVFLGHLREFLFSGTILLIHGGCYGWSVITFNKFLHIHCGGGSTIVEKSTLTQ